MPGDGRTIEQAAAPRAGGRGGQQPSWTQQRHDHIHVAWQPG